jgi:plasmid stabilization system protein ParE
VSVELVIRPEAEADVAEAFEWYEARREGLGHEFIRTVEAALAAILRHPESFPVVYKEVRRVMTRRFPYGIFYLLEESAIIVLAVFHAKRDPNEWRRRASGSR